LDDMNLRIFQRSRAKATHREVMIVATDDTGAHRYRLYEINPVNFEPTPLCGHAHEDKTAARHCTDARLH